MTPSALPCGPRDRRLTDLRPSSKQQAARQQAAGSRQQAASSRQQAASSKGGGLPEVEGVTGAVAGDEGVKGHGLHQVTALPHGTVLAQSSAGAAAAAAAAIATKATASATQVDAGLVARPPVPPCRGWPTASRAPFPLASRGTSSHAAAPPCREIRHGVRQEGRLPVATARPAQPPRCVPPPTPPPPPPPPPGRAEAGSRRG